MSLTKRVVTVLSAFVIFAAGGFFAASPAMAAYGNASCPRSQPAVSPQTSWQAFAFHKIVVRARVCKLLGPLTQLVYVGDPAISLPTTVPGGGVGEEVSLSAGPTLIEGSSRSVKYRFTITQKVLHIPGGTNFVYDAQYQISGTTYRVRICNVSQGSACNSWTNF